MSVLVENPEFFNNDETKICTHLDVDINNYCINCGEQVNELFMGKITDDTLPIKKNVIKTLSPIICKLDISPDIINEANKVLEDLCKKAEKLKKKTKLDFYCLYKAYQNLKISKDTHNLGKLLGLGTKDINSAIITYSKLEGKGIGEFKNTSAIQLVDEYCNKIDFKEDAIEEVKDILNIVMSKNNSLNDENPRKLVCSVIKYYMTINGINYNKDTFKSILGFSDATLNILSKKIGNIYTS